MKQKIDKIIIWVLWILTIWTLISFFFLNGQLTIRNILAFTSLIVLTILMILKIKKFKTIFGLILIGGTINGLVFTPIDFYIQFGVTIAKSIDISTFGIQPISLILLSFLILTHKKEIKKIILDTLYETPEEIEERQINIIKSFKVKFQNKSISELQEIIDNKDSFTDVAVQAANKLIKEKTNVQHTE